MTLSHAGVDPLAEQIVRRRTAAFSHTARLADNVPARLSLSSKNWKRRLGRPRNRWLDLIRQDSVPLLICGEGRSFVVMVLE